ncbi:hypothetical protein TVAG_602280 [Trichomonas vaginalis G3]|uniref:Uncharacterized protein n=1 Tax=Trichomonas vaginalis (strain ATCC PRA-98 / G3) TaxID=412133 RepID=A2GB35_TRIV3|nr:leucine-rich repeats (6 copies)-containing protein [Trichomonas vaginalis G3]EAX85635.1 hypothetical protein TVAG_602280 [Trichomonas vaginalis G3]KAI5495885.1 leucine-rich repeats (6 copies)-containing protein [Trichomonas vaginalis G3]|eukprot:XP_001298565.1 hypothetical protein [Trichomonas vaginalis G3]
MANCDYQTVTEIFVGEGITSFTTGVFNSFASLKKLNLPSSLQSSTGQDTRNCYVLETITLAEGSQNLEVDEFGVLYNKGKTCIIRFPPKKNAKNFKFPSETTTIGEGAFQYCLTQWHLLSK